MIVLRYALLSFLCSKCISRVQEMSRIHFAKFAQNIHLITLVVCGLIAMPAHAYLDPGSGSLIIQSVIGAIAAIGVTLKLYWHKIKLKLGGRQSPDIESEPTEGRSTKD